MDFLADLYNHDHELNLNNEREQQSGNSLGKPQKVAIKKKK